MGALISLPANVDGGVKVKPGALQPESPPSAKPVLIARASGKGAEDRRQQGREGGYKRHMPRPPIPWKSQSQPLGLKNPTTTDAQNHTVDALNIHACIHVPESSIPNMKRC